MSGRSRDRGEDSGSRRRIWAGRQIREKGEARRWKKKGVGRDAPLDGAQQEAQLALSRGFGVLRLRPVPAHAAKMGKVSVEVRWDGRAAVRAQIFKRTDMCACRVVRKSGSKWGRGRTSLASARR